MKIAISRVDGGVSIMSIVVYPSINDTVAKERLAYIADEIDKWKATSPDQYISHAVIDDADVPQDRVFRNAWSLVDRAVEVDMERAREIQKDRLRAARAPALAELDVTFMRALESGDGETQTAAATRKQTLRDITADPRIDRAATPEELVALTLEVLVPDA